jgi:hypothetical protein
MTSIGDEQAARKPRFGALKIAGLIALTLAVLCGGSIVWIGCEGRAQMREIAAETPARIAAVRARDGRRPVLYGEALPGRAWDDYSTALTAMDTYKGNEVQRNAIAAYLQGGKGEPAELDKILDAYGAALVQLSAGAHRGDGTYAIEWERGTAADLPGLLASQNLSNLACAKARRLAAQGKYREALDRLSDVLTLGHDLAFNGVLITHMIGLANYALAFDALLSFVADEALPPAELAELSRRLEIVDNSFPTLSHSVTNDMLWLRVTIVGGGAADIPSINLLTADGIRKIDAYAARGGELTRKPWKEAQAEAARLQKDVEAAWNPIVRIAAVHFSAFDRAIREKLTHLRLIRTYVNFRIKSPGPVLDDPFGEKILGAGPLFWSVARNGADDGGSGSWKVDGLDIVLDLAKK